jgi:hypothetical protein
MSVLDRAKRAWGDAAPDWVISLAIACDRDSQNAVSKKLGYSAAVVSGVLVKKYPGNLEKIERMVRGTFMRERVDCPVLGDIPASSCVNNQRQAFSTANRLSVQMQRACPTCVNSQTGGKGNVE